MSSFPVDLRTCDTFILPNDTSGYDTDDVPFIGEDYEMDMIYIEETRLHYIRCQYIKYRKLMLRCDVDTLVIIDGSDGDDDMDSPTNCESVPDHSGYDSDDIPYYVDFGDNDADPNRRLEHVQFQYMEYRKLMLNMGLGVLGKIDSIYKFDHYTK